MASERKHISLPDVDTTQPDTYETPDAPHQAYEFHNNVDTDNENIERGGVTAKSAFAKFATYAKEADGVNKINIPKTGGFLSKQKDFEILDDKVHETPLQKFHRLQFEVKQFLDDLEILSKSQPNNSIEQEVTPLELTQQLVMLQNQLQGLVTDERARAMLDPEHFIQHYSHLQTDLSKKLEAELSNIKKSLGAAPQSGTSQERTITYELYYTPDQAKHLQASKLVDIERRVASIETLVGSPNGGPPLISAVSDLRDKVALLDPRQLDSIQLRMKTLLPQLEAAGSTRPQTEAKSIAASPATEKKISELYEIMNRWDLVAQQLPALVNRLSALRTVHEDSLNFSATLNKLESEQRAISGLLKNNTGLLNKVDDSFQENISIIKQNIASLEERLKNASG